MTITQTFKRAVIAFLHNIQREQKKNQHLKQMASLEKFKPSSIYEIMVGLLIASTTITSKPLLKVFGFYYD